MTFGKSTTAPFICLAGSNISCHYSFSSTGANHRDLGLTLSSSGHGLSLNPLDSVVSRQSHHPKSGH